MLEGLLKREKPDKTLRGKKRENKIKRDSLSPEERGDFSGPEFFPPSGKMAKGGIVKKKKSMGTKWEAKWG